MESSPKIIAIDGVAASGKGTLTKSLARIIGYDFLDTGAIYRIVGYYILANNISFEDREAIIAQIKKINFNAIENISIESEEVGRAASKLAVIPEVRELLNVMQRTFPLGKVGVVMDGRDIGTVIFPNADLKFFITADVNKRAERRFKQLHDVGKSVTFEQVLGDLQERDERDRNRAIASTMPAEDAIVMDTSDLSAQEVLQQVLDIVKQRILS